MPELPEIETLRTEMAPLLRGRRVVRVNAYRDGLRDPFPADVLALKNAPILEVDRRSKYLIIRFAHGSLLLHLGMSGQARLMDAATPRVIHDHLDLVLDDGRVLRLRDPRRFGTVLWQPTGSEHPRLHGLGPEPLSADFTPAYLAQRLAGKKGPLKTAIMDASVVVGVGNIYATEALFAARLSPHRPAGCLSAPERRRLVAAVRGALQRGIDLGGSSLRDYVHADGSKGGFLAQSKVYGRGGLPCVRCGKPLVAEVLGGRGTVWCPFCQT